MLVEGAAGVALAAFLKTRDKYLGKKVVVLICGANIGIDKLRRILA
jgi:threonine dehydratase